MWPFRIACHAGSSTTYHLLVEVWAPTLYIAEAVARQQGYVPVRNAS